MKLIKYPNGMIELQTMEGRFLSAIPGGQYVHLHPREDGAILISEKSDRQEVYGALVLRAAEVKEVFGTAFSGDREALARLLTQHF